MRILLGSISIVMLFLAPAYAEPIDSAASKVASTFAKTDIAEATSPAFLEKLSKPTKVLGFSEDEFQTLASAAKEAHSTLSLTKIEPTHQYDVVLQVGHFARKKGVTGGEGYFVNEQQIAAYVVKFLAGELKRNDVDVAVIGADNYKTVKTKIFLSLHTDSHGTQCRVGPSIGYDDPQDAIHMKYVAAILAVSLGYNPKKFMKDNYTKNLRYYYGFRRANTTLYEGLLEMSELSCPDQEKNLLINSEVLAKNLSTAIRISLGKPNL